MPKLEQRTLKNDVFQAERTLASIATEQGKGSPEYRSALKRFTRLWFVLKLTRSRDEFFQEVTGTNN